MKAKASPNIAFIKYWGKAKTEADKDKNLATNPSLSMTLSKAFTITEVTKNSESQHSVFLNGKAADELTKNKVIRHVERIEAELGTTPHFYTVQSENNFPTASGIASSASGFAALTLATVAEILGRAEAEELLKKKPEFFSSLSRRGSGSSCRSFTGPFVLWDGASAEKIPPENWNLYDTVVVFDSQAKKTSSSEGHERVWTSPKFEQRLSLLGGRLEKLHESLCAQNLQSFGLLIEEEAREMHAVMESSNPPISYRSPACLKLLEAVEALPRRDYFWTLDAGPNPHFISERPIKEDLEAHLSALGLEADIWEDKCGYGPELID